MKLVDATFKTPEENLACDEALLDMCEEGYADDVLRFWEPEQHFVVLGYSGKLAREVHENVCREKQIPILRRISGGGTVLQGPSCLNYALVMRMDANESLSTISGANAFVMERNRRALQRVLQQAVEIKGHTDLVLLEKKFSGNSQRRKQRCLLFHGTFLLHFDIGLTQEVLQLPARQPPYRSNRSHTEFMINLELDSEVVKEALRREWNADGVVEEIPLKRINDLVKSRYETSQWNKRR